MKKKKEITEENKIEEGKIEFPWTGLIIIGGIAILMVVCIIIIYANGGPR